MEDTPSPVPLGEGGPQGDWRKSNMLFYNNSYIFIFAINSFYYF